MSSSALPTCSAKHNLEMMTGSPRAFSLTEAALSTEHCPNNGIYNVLKSYSTASSATSGPASECQVNARSLLGYLI